MVAQPDPKKPALAAYLGAFFRGDEPYVYFDLSNGNDALAYTPLNGGNPILKPTLGTGGVRDPNIVAGGGIDADSKWYLLGTDLDISKFNHDWDAPGRHGSRSILIWESTDLITWTAERLVEVEKPTAGMAWAPKAIWSDEINKYLVFWSSHFFQEEDPDHVGDHSMSCIRYATTSDFVSFSKPRDYVKIADTSIIDLSFLHLGGSSYLRFLKNQTTHDRNVTSYVYMERTEEGLFGGWHRPGGSGSYICGNSEGPGAWWDNNDPGKAYLLLDNIGLDDPQCIPFEASEFDDQRSWRRSDKTTFPAGRRHGSVIGINKDRYEALRLHYKLN